MEKTKSTTDPESGLFVKGEHERCFAYVANTACDRIYRNNQVLKYTTTNREGYKEYKSDPKICKNCPYRDKCTMSPNMTKVVTRHIWAEYMEQAEEYRYVPKYKAIYKERKETIERVFAEGKERHGLRYATMRGLANYKCRRRLFLRA